MNNNAESQRRWKAAQRAQGRRRVEFWVTEEEKERLIWWLRKMRGQIPRGSP